MRKIDFQQSNLLFWGGIGAVVLLVLLGVLLGDRLFQPPTPTPIALPANETVEPALDQRGTPTPSVTTTPTARGTEAVSIPAAQTPIPIQVKLPEVTPPADGEVYLLTPVLDGAGWVRAEDTARNHLGDYNIYAGLFNEQPHIGAVQFDLSTVPPGAQIVHADLTLTGLSDEFLGEDGSWSVQLLQPWMDSDWQNKDFATLSREDATSTTLQPPLSADDLDIGRANTFAFDPQTLSTLERRVFSGRASFRVLGPTTGDANLFSWDAGTGAESRGASPVLRIVTGPAPAIPPPPPAPEYVVVTSTPTPENALTAVPLAATATYQATTTGTPTPPPPNWATPFVVTNTPTPATAGTATTLAAAATAITELYGTPTPLPANAWTATPVPPTPVVVVQTPEVVVVENMMTAVPIVLAATARAENVAPGAPLPRPLLVITPFVVLPTPTYESAAVATFAAGERAAIAALYGTPVPLPPNARTATPRPPATATLAPTQPPPPALPTEVPLLIPIENFAPTPTRTPEPSMIPAALSGKILFVSDRLGRPTLMAMNPDGTGLSVVTQEWVHRRLEENQSFSPDGQSQAIVHSQAGPVLQIFLRYLPNEGLRQLTQFEVISYDPAWSPNGNTIAFVSTEAGNDEIYTINIDGSNLQRLTSNQWEWDKHPTWSPDGSQIVFWSNRESGRRQIWIMNADGSNPRNLSNSQSNDWDPVWVR